MRILGFILFLLGCTLATGYAARHMPDDGITASGDDGAITAMDRLSAWGGTAGVEFLGGFALMVAGGLVARRAGKAEAAERQAKRGDQASFKEQLEFMASVLAELPEVATADNVEATQGKLDELLEERIPAFVDDRLLIIEELGLERYAGMIGAFAGMERSTARAWSAITDECFGEVGPSLAKAKDALGHTIAAFDA